MACGIYLLKFLGTSKVYIGQSQNIQKRYQQHVTSLRSKKASPKLQQAYNNFGTPSCEIILECSIAELDTVEDEAISIWNSVDDGFNTYRFANQAPTNTEYGSGNTKYTKQQILTVFDLLIHTDLSYKQIQEKTGVLESTVYNICALKSHTWLKEEDPINYEILTVVKDYRKAQARQTVSDKLSAKARGIVYPKIQDPAGIVYQIDNAYKFAKEQGLAPNHFQEVLNGHRKSHKGWKLCPEEQA